MNQAIEFFDLSIRGFKIGGNSDSSSSTSSGAQEIVGIVATRSDDVTLLYGSGLKPHEREYMVKVLETIAEKDGQRVTLNEIGKYILFISISYLILIISYPTYSIDINIDIDIDIGLHLLFALSFLSLSIYNTKPDNIDFVGKTSFTRRDKVDLIEKWVAEKWLRKSKGNSYFMFGYRTFLELPSVLNNLGIEPPQIRYY